MMTEGTGAGLASAEQRAEACLIKVMVGGERVGDLSSAHNHKRCAVGKRPMLIRTAGVLLNPVVDQFRVGRQDFESLVTTQVAPEWNKAGTVTRSREIVPKLHHDECGGDHFSLEVLHVIGGRVVMFVWQAEE